MEEKMMMMIRDTAYDRSVIFGSVLSSETDEKRVRRVSLLEVLR
jgi:hypothetical protein